MHPYQLRLLIMSAVLLTLLLLLTIGFGAVPHTTVHMLIKSNSFTTLCVDYEYGLFEGCHKDCRPAIQSDEKCESIDYDRLDAPWKKPKDAHDSSAAKGEIAVVCLSYVVVVACSVFLVVNVKFPMRNIFMYIQCVVLGVASIAAIAAESAYRDEISDTWDKHESDTDDAQSSQGIIDAGYSYESSKSVSTGWAFSLYVFASVVMVIHACVMAFITKRYALTGDDHEPF